MVADILAAVIILMGIGSGVGMMWWWPSGLDRGERVSFGAVIGLAGLAWIGLVVLMLTGPGLSAWLTIASLEAVLLALVGFSLHHQRQSGRGASTAQAAVRPGYRLIFRYLWYGGWLLLFGWITWRVAGLDESGMTTAPANNYGDMAFHLSVISSFAFGGNLPPESPIFAGIPFTYPFLVDLLTAIPIGMGAGWRTSFMVVNLPLLMALVGIMESLGRRLAGSAMIGRLALFVFVFNGGLGFLRFSDELRRLVGRSEGLNEVVGLLANLPESYTINNSLHLAGSEIALRYGNLVTSLLIPQRSLLFGLPVVGMIVILWYLGVSEEDRSVRRRVLWGAGLLTGVLPLLHAHGFLAVMMVAIPMALVFWRREWIGFFVPALILALPQALWLSQSGVRRSLFEWQRWWEAGEANPALFWLANTGLFLVVLMAMMALMWWRKDRRLLFYLPFLLWFIIPNLVRLAPWAWDNIKIFVYWAMISSVVVGQGVALLVSGRRMIARGAGVALLVILTLSGLLDVWRGLSPVEKVVLLTREDLRVAARLRETTEARALILHAPIHNSPVILTGRRSLMGYPGHLWSHGIDYAEREADLREMMLLTPRAPDLLKRYGVGYVLTGEDDTGYRDRYPLVFVEGGTRLYKVGE